MNNRLPKQVQEALRSFIDASATPEERAEREAFIKEVTASPEEFRAELRVWMQHYVAMQCMRPPERSKVN